ncbi:MAG TPA: pilus assembly protein PilM, partial [Polyangiaceae bacterium]
MAKYVGIDIGASSIKVAVLRTAYRKLFVDALEKVDVGADAAAALKEAFGKAVGTQGSDGIATALPGVLGSIHRLEIPASAQKQLAEVLPFELESQTPLDVSEAVIDFKILPGKSSEGMLPIMAALARITDVRERIDLIKTATGTEPERVGLGAFPLGNLVAYVGGLGDPGPIAILDLGTKGSDLLILRAGDAVFARTLSLGTDGLPGTAP